MRKFIYNYQLLICDMTVDCKKVNFCLGQRQGGHGGVGAKGIGEGGGKGMGEWG